MNRFAHSSSKRITQCYIHLLCHSLSNGGCLVANSRERSTLKANVNEYVTYSPNSDDNEVQKFSDSVVSQIWDGKVDCLSVSFSRTFYPI